MLPSPPIPADEPQRLAALHSYGLLDTAAEPEFDDIVLRVARIFGAPMAMLSLLDRDRQWFKSKVGVDVSETPREIAFCAHAILQDHVMVVEDATRDRRFAQNPLVTGSPGVRFYVGAPLIGRGQVRLGTLCAVKQEPSCLTELQRKQLVALSRLAVARMEYHRTQRSLNGEASL